MSPPRTSIDLNFNYQIALSIVSLSTTASNITAVSRVCQPLVSPALSPSLTTPQPSQLPPPTPAGSQRGSEFYQVIPPCASLSEQPMFNLRSTRSTRPGSLLTRLCRRAFLHSRPLATPRSTSTHCPVREAVSPRLCRCARRGRVEASANTGRFDTTQLHDVSFPHALAPAISCAVSGGLLCVHTGIVTEQCNDLLLA
jgi:hypothetical protein